MFKNPFSFEGRIRRTEYGLSYIIYFVTTGVLSVLADSTESDVIFLIAIIPLLWFMIAQGAKRSHDIGNSGWFQLIPFYVFWLLFASSNYGENEYGPNPKGIGNFNEIDQIGKDLLP